MANLKNSLFSIYILTGGREKISNRAFKALNLSLKEFVSHLLSLVLVQALEQFFVLATNE